MAAHGGGGGGGGGGGSMSIGAWFVLGILALCLMEGLRSEHRLAIKRAKIEHAFKNR